MSKHLNLINLFQPIHFQSVYIQQTKERVESFKENIPIIQALCNPGLRDRHWEKLSEIVGFQLKPEEVRHFNCRFPGIKEVFQQKI